MHSITTSAFRKAAALGLIAIATGTSPAIAGLYTASYLGGGIWEQDGNWSTTAYPQNGHFVTINDQPVPDGAPKYNVAIDIAAPCALGTYVNVETVNVFSGSTLNLGATGYMNLWANTGLGNAGLITLSSTASERSGMRLGADSNVANGGVISMNDGPSNFITGGASGKVFTVLAGGIIRGAGYLNTYLGDDVRTYMQWVNHGLIEATQPVNPLTILLTYEEGVTNAVINDGTLRATGQGVLRISTFNIPGNVLNEGGTIAALENGTVRVVSPVTVVGGTLATDASGTIRGDVSGGLGGTFKDLVNTGTMAVGEGENFGLAGTFTNNSLVRLDGGTNNTAGVLMRGASVTLTGTGLYTMSPGSAIVGGDGTGQTATITSGITVRGAGQIGTNNSNFLYKVLNVVNQGLIDATGPLTIYVRDDLASNLTNNNGTLRASSGGVLTFDGVGNVFNSGGTIDAQDGSTVRVNSLTTVDGGVVTTSGSGVLRGAASGGGTLKNVTSSGTVAIGPSEILFLAGTFTNNNTVRFEGSSTQDASLLLRNDVTLAGTGLFSMEGERAGIAGAEAVGKTMTVGPGLTIRGNGTIGTNNSNFTYKGLNVVNQGVIEATSGLTIYVRSSEGSDVANNGGTLRADQGAVLAFNGLGKVQNNADGLIDALGTIQFDAGAQLINNAAATIKLSGGSITAPSGVDLNGGQLVGNGTVTGTIRNNGGIVAPGFSPGKITVTGDYVQGADGVLNIEIGGAAAGAEYDQLVVSGNAALDGTLNISFINGFRPAVGDMFALILPSSFTGAFSTVNVNGSGYAGTVDYSTNGVTLTVTTVPSQLLNISTRLNVLGGDNALIGGFIVTGTEAKKVIIRGGGPSLPVNGKLADPRLELFKAGVSIASNDDWKESQQSEIEQTTIPPDDEKEPAIVATLEPGAYTAILRGKAGATGIGRVEVYDLAQAAKSKLANISTRGFVDTGDNAMIGGFIVGGGGGEAKVVVRAIGPSLEKDAVEGALQDPTLELHDANGATIQSNDNWRTDQEQEIVASQVPPIDDRESALVVTLAPGNYTAIVRGADQTTGVGLVEVYNVQ